MAMDLLFGSDVGLFSLFTILGVVVMGAGFLRFFLKNMAEDERRAKG
jgi:hypothetical protein